MICSNPGGGHFVVVCVDGVLGQHSFALENLDDLGRKHKQLVVHMVGAVIVVFRVKFLELGRQDSSDARLLEQ